MNLPVIIDESHQSVPQIRGMFNGDASRKKVLVEHGFRLPSALDNRPLKFPEFEAKMKRCLYVSATPGPYELGRVKEVAEQVIRPTGLMDPEIEVRKTEGQIDDLIGEVKARAVKGERTLVTTLTKKMAEDLSRYLKELGIKVNYIHSEFDAFERVEILRALLDRTGEEAGPDVLVDAVGRQQKDIALLDLEHAVVDLDLRIDAQGAAQVVLLR